MCNKYEFSMLVEGAVLIIKIAACFRFLASFLWLLLIEREMAFPNFWQTELCRKDILIAKQCNCFYKKQVYIEYFICFRAFRYCGCNCGCKRGTASGTLDALIS